MLFAQNASSGQATARLVDPHGPKWNSSVQNGPLVTVTCAQFGLTNADFDQSVLS